MCEQDNDIMYNMKNWFDNETSPLAYEDALYKISMVPVRET